MLDHWNWTETAKVEVTKRVVEASKAMLRAAADYVGVTQSLTSDIEEKFVC